jgi:hypothetical protein
MRTLLAGTFLLALVSYHAIAENATIPGEITTPYPTVTNLAVEWKIKGDDNLNGVVAVRFRQVGEEQWHDAMPLRRVPAGKSRGTTPIFSWENKFSGSIFDLHPNTEYEINLKLADPDGGQDDKTVRARTRPVPRVTDGEVVKVPAGKHDVLSPRNGQPGRPVVYMCAEGEAIYKFIDLENKKWVYIEGLTVKNLENDHSIAVKMAGAENCVVRRCKIEAVYGITAYKPGATNCYLSDNTITGTTVWTSEAMGANGKNVGEGIQITGSGNVVCYNKVSNFRDTLSTMEDDGVSEQICDDFYNNDIYIGADDGIEADFCFNNCRIMRNRLTNCFMGLSSQPGLGGPTYFIRNVMYNLTHAPYKLYRFSQGDVCLHNTVVKIGDGMCAFTSDPFDYAFFRNNLAIGGPNPQGKWGDYEPGTGNPASMSSPGPHCDFDYDAVGSVGGGGGTGRIGNKSFAQAEPHGITIDMKVFNNVEFPSKPIPGYDPPDLRPVQGSKVVDAALLLPNINDKFLGNGPDIGAYEAGQELPTYGPRAPGVDEETEFIQRDLAAKSLAAKKTAKPEVPVQTGPTPEELTAAQQAVQAAADKAASLFREHIAKAAAAGRAETVFIDFSGMNMRAEITSADAEQFTAKTAAGLVPMPWSSQSPKRFADIAAKYADDSALQKAQLAALYAAAGDLAKAAEKLAGLGDLDDEWKSVAAKIQLLIQAAPAGAPAQDVTK